MVLTLKPDFDFDAEFYAQNGDINLPAVERLSDSPLVEKVWYSRSERGGSFISTAETHCEIVVTSYQNRTFLTVRGPETQPTAAYCPPNTEFMEIVFKVDTFMPRFPASMLMDRRDIDLPQAGSNSFWLDSSAWEFSDYENADTFINRLVREGLLVNDEVIDLTLRDQSSFTDRSRRTIQRRFLQATGQHCVSNSPRALRHQFVKTGVVHPGYRRTGRIYRSIPYDPRTQAVYGANTGADRHWKYRKAHVAFVQDSALLMV